MEISMTLLFWISAILLVYVLIGYPLAIGIWSRLKPRLWQRQSLEPFVSIVIAAHNEAPSIKKKIQNLLELHLLRFQFLFGLLALIYVGKQGKPPNNTALRIKLRFGAAEKPAIRAFAVSHSKT